MASTRGVLIYGVGSVGTSVARLCVESGIPVVAAVNRLGPKVGRSLAELTGRKELASVIVRASLEEALRSASADIAIVGTADRLVDGLSTYLDCLRAGLNVISSGCEASYPAAVSADMAALLHREAVAAGVTFTGTGFQDAYRIWLPITMASAGSHLTRITQRSLVDIGRHGPASAELAGAGLDPSVFEATITRGDSGFIPIYRVFQHQLMEAFGWKARSVSHIIEPVLHRGSAPREFQGLAIRPGQTIGARFGTEVTAENGAVLSGISELRLLEAGEEEHMEWEALGTAPARLRLSGVDSEAATAGQIVNRIPDVLAAPPGLVTIAELGPARPLGGGPVSA